MTAARARRPVPDDFDPPMPPAAVLARHGARVLDPAAAEWVGGGRRPRASAYITGRLLVTDDLVDTDLDINAVIDRAADQLGWATDAVSSAERAQQTPPRRVGGRVREVTIEIPQDVRRQPPDAWKVLQQARTLESRSLRGLALDHVMFANPGFIGAPFHQSNPFHESNPFHQSNPVEGAALSGYGQPGGGGRQPVVWLGPPPGRTTVEGRRPLVAVLDTGCGEHPWLTEGVTRVCDLDGQALGLTDPDTAPETYGDVNGPLDGLIDPLAGHGTFIAGLVRQACPDADILALRVVHGDGMIIESELVRALDDLAELVQRCAAGEPGGMAIDVLNLSMGYYHEDPDDSLFDSPLLATLQSMGRCGTVVVTSAGNDATSRPMFPAAFTPYAGGLVSQPDPQCVPVVSVGALNPNGTAALFSNAGDWVSCWAQGAALVSTIPPFDGGAQPAVATEQPESVRAGAPPTRESLDPDDFSGQFAVWSGTSFAAPLVAGRIAQHLLRLGQGGQTLLDDTSPVAAVPRGWSAVSEVTKLQQ